jgi:hypothetical protein
MEIKDFIKKIPQEKINGVLLAIAFIGIAGCIAVFIPTVRSIIIASGESLIHRKINHDYWYHQLAELAGAGLFDCMVILFIVFRKHPVICNASTLLKNYLNNHSRLIITLFFILMTINFLKFLNLPVAGTGLDPSWGWGINNLAYNRLYTFGKDVTFTYGPLGYLLNSLHYGNNIIQGIGLNVFCIAVILFLFYLNYRKNQYSLQKIVIFSLLLFVFPGMVSFEWIWNIMLFFLFLTCWILREDKYIRFPLIIGAGFLSAFSLLLKFNTAAFAVALAGFLGVMFLLHDRKKQFIIYFCLFSAAYIVFTAGSIMILFKNVNNFVLWLKMSLEVSGGFSSAMATNGPLPHLLAAVLIIFLYLRFVYFQRKKPVFALYFIGFAVVFFSFKHGFVRQDRHMISFFSTIPFLTGFLFLFSPKDAYKRSLVIFQVSTFLCFFGIINFVPLSTVKSVFKNTYFITQLKKNYQTFDRRKMEAMKEDILPAEWNVEIGNNSIQILPWELSYVEANHWGGWQPNPVLQLYSVYTKKLDEYSAQVFMSEKAPHFILLEYKIIDNRNMFMDTPATWNAIFPNYTIAKQDTSRLLLSKKETHTGLNFALMFSNTYKFNETILIPESTDPVYAKIIIKDSFLGKIITMLFRGNPPEMTVIYQNGNEKAFRIITDTLQNPAMINYIPYNFDQTSIFFNFEESDKKELNLFAVEKIKISNRASFFYKKNITVEWFRPVK